MNSDIYNYVVDFVARTAIELGLENKGERFSRWHQPTIAERYAEGPKLVINCEPLFKYGRGTSKFDRRRDVGNTVSNSVTLLLRDAVKSAHYDLDADLVRIELSPRGLACDNLLTHLMTPSGHRIDPERLRLTVGEFRRMCREIEEAA